MARSQKASMKKIATVCLSLVVVCLFAAGALAQTSSGNAAASGPGAASDAQSARIAKLEQAVAEAKSAGDNAWMLMSSALVLMMTGPGLALFYGGLVRKKNVLATMMQSFALMAMVTLLWGLVSFSLAFGSGNSFIGGLHHIFLRGVGAQPDPAYAATIPLQTFMVYQLMFAIITPALITGAFAERMKFSAMAAFMGVVVAGGVFPHGAHGLGQRRSAECLSRRTVPLSRLCRRHGGARHLGRFGVGVRAVSGASPRVSQAVHASA
jgi:ammonium transporter, Amt family